MFEIVGFYKFVKISYLKKNQKVLLEALKKKNIRGTIIISKEGVNGTISGKAADIKFIINNLKRTLKFKEFNTSNVSISSFQPFHKPKVKIKNEVVPMNLFLNKRIKKKDSHVDPIKWNKLLETLLVLNSLNLRVLFKLLIMNIISAALPEIAPFTPSLEIIIVPLMFFFFKVSNKTF